MSQLTNVTGALAVSTAVACAALAARLVGWLPAANLSRWLPWMQASAAGLLLGDGLLHMLPEAMDRGISAARLGGSLSIGVVFLLSIECFVRAMKSPSTTATFAKMDVIGDFFHHLVDGIVIGASFVITPAMGLIVGIAILAHEIPRETSNAAVLVAGGYTPGQAFRWSLNTTIAIPLGALSMTLASHTSAFIGTSLALAAGTTLYLAMGDIIPSIWPNVGTRTRLLPLLGVAAGLLFMWVAKALEQAV
jgi:zinc and cadmium transporter